MTQNGKKNGSSWVLRRTAAVVAAAIVTAAIFLFLPLMQTIGSPSSSDLNVRSLDVASLDPPPPPPPMEEPEEEPEAEETPELIENAPPLDLNQLELALNPMVGEGTFGNFRVKLVNQLTNGGGKEEVNRIFSLADLDQRPRVIFQRVPNYPPELRRRQGTVYIVFLVDTHGRVVNPKVERSTDPAFERPALEAVKQWRFEAGTRNGEKVAFKMRAPITFNAG
jgi:protein TonB